MRWIILLTLFLFNETVSAKEWRNLKEFQKVTQKQNLSPSDWLKSDRRKNTIVWQNANQYNLAKNLPKEYSRIIERKDFYKWLYIEFDKKGHQVVWIKMAHYISTKLHKMESFPYSIFSRKKILKHTNNGSEIVFNNAFKELNKLFASNKILKGEEAAYWDKDILYKEQYIWIDIIYKTMDARSLKKLERIAKGNFLYSLVVPKEIRFNNNLSNAKARYNYAFNTLRGYCEKTYK